MGFFSKKTFQDQLKAFLLECSIKYGLDETDLDKMIRMGHSLRLEKIEDFQRLAELMAAHKLFEKPEEDMLAFLKERF